MDDTKSQLDEKKLQEKIAAEFEKMITGASSDVGVSLVNPITEMFIFVENIRLELSARAAEAQRVAESFVATAGNVAAAIADSTRCVACPAPTLALPLQKSKPPPC